MIPSSTIGLSEILLVRDYEYRTDEYGLIRHRRLYDSFKGTKREFNDPGEYDSV